MRVHRSAHPLIRLYFGEGIVHLKLFSYQKDLSKIRLVKEFGGKWIVKKGDSGNTGALIKASLVSQGGEVKITFIIMMGMNILIRQLLLILMHHIRVNSFMVLN